MVYYSLPCQSWQSSVKGSCYHSKHAVEHYFQVYNNRITSCFEMILHRYVDVESWRNKMGEEKKKKKKKANAMGSGSGSRVSYPLQ